MRRDAYGLGVALALMLVQPAFAAGFSPFQLADEGEVCYSWEGGHKSAGSYSRCQPTVQVAVLQPIAPPPVVEAAPLAAPPVCPPQISVMPEPKKPRILRKRPPVPKC